MSRVLVFETRLGKPVLRGHDHFWIVIRDLDRAGSWSVADVHYLTGGGIDRSTVRDFVKRLVAGGIAEEVVVVGNPVRYRLLKAPIATPCLRRDGTPGLQGRGQIAMWNVMRGPLGAGGFTADEVALWASTKSVRVAPASAVSYVKHLAQAGYLVCLRKGVPGRRGQYRLKPSMGIGPLPPLILRSQLVFDQNKGEVVGPVVAREVAP